MPGMPQTQPPGDNPNPLLIFRAARHTDGGGQVLNFSEADLSAIAEGSDPARHEAPLVVGHPMLDKPAKGWVQSVTAPPGAGLLATPRQVDAAFAEQVNAGAFKKISAAFYGPTAPGNPMPGQWSLKHVGFLGAAPPAVKGLGDAHFAEPQDPGVHVFSEWDDATNASMWRRMREWFIAKFGMDEADKVLPDYQVRSLEIGAMEEIKGAETAAATSPASPAFAEPGAQTPTTPKESTVTEEEAARMRADLAARDATIDQMRAAAQAAAAAQAHAAHVAFAESQLALKLAPPQRGRAVAVFDHLAAQPDTACFAEGDVKTPLLKVLQELLLALPDNAAFAEQASKDRAAGADGQAAPDEVQFAESDPARLAQHRAIKAHMAAHKCDYPTAMQAVASRA